jgi:hypothetical protein
MAVNKRFNLIKQKNRLSIYLDFLASFAILLGYMLSGIVLGDGLGD